MLALYVQKEGSQSTPQPRGLKSVRKQLQQELVQAAMGTSPIAWGMERSGSSPGELSLGLSPEGQVVVNEENKVGWGYEEIE